MGKLLDAGFRVAIAEQVEDPATAKGLVRREIIRIHTPGTVSETELLDGSERCFLAAFGGDDEARAGVARAQQRHLRGPPHAAIRRRRRSSSRACGRASSWSPTEWDGWRGDVAAGAGAADHHARSGRGLFARPPASNGCKRVLGVLFASRLRAAILGELLVGMAGRLLGYVEATQKGALTHLSRSRCRTAATRW
jgi:DNA mismatch repair protein MutS